MEVGIGGVHASEESEILDVELEFVDLFDFGGAGEPGEGQPGK